MRRAAAKCLAALIGTLGLTCCLTSTAPGARAHPSPKEREENVKADVFGLTSAKVQTRPPKGWMEVMEEPTQTGSNLQMLRGQVCLPTLPSLSPTSQPFLPPHCPHLLSTCCVPGRHEVPDRTVSGR